MALHYCNVPACPGYPWSPSGTSPHPCGSRLPGPDGYDARATADGPPVELLRSLVHAYDDGLGWHGNTADVRALVEYLARLGAPVEPR